jgi:hypothetical protein
VGALSRTTPFLYETDCKVSPVIRRHVPGYFSAHLPQGGAFLLRYLPLS